MRRSETIVVIATASHWKAFSQELEKEGFEPSAIGETRLVFLDARETLAGFMVDGQPDPERFENTVGALIRRLRAQPGEVGLCAYGEMVDLLWNAGHSSAALRLEDLWNELLEASPFSLLCAYQMDVFDKEFQSGVLNGVLCAHTRLVSEGDGEATVLWLRNNLPDYADEILERARGAYQAAPTHGHGNRN